MTCNIITKSLKGNLPGETCKNETSKCIPYGECYDDITGWPVEVDFCKDDTVCCEDLTLITFPTCSAEGRGVCVKEWSCVQTYGGSPGIGKDCEPNKEICCVKYDG